MIIYTVALAGAGTWDDVFDLQDDINYWCEENGARNCMDRTINTRSIIIKDNMDGVAFKLKFGQYIIKEENI